MGDRKKKIGRKKKFKHNKKQETGLKKKETCRKQATEIVQETGLEISMDVERKTN